MNNRDEFSTFSLLVVRMLRSFCLRRPVSLSMVPPWDFTLVLKGLQEPPFEPLEEADFLWLLVKTTLLVAITSAKRVGE